jgi:hypothetical protein
MIRLCSRIKEYKSPEYEYKIKIENMVDKFNFQKHKYLKIIEEKDKIIQDRDEQIKNLLQIIHIQRIESKIESKV